jgi:hypothetical protein
MCERERERERERVVYYRITLSSNLQGGKKSSFSTTVYLGDISARHCVCIYTHADLRQPHAKKKNGQQGLIYMQQTRGTPVPGAGRASGGGGGVGSGGGRY